MQLAPGSVRHPDGVVHVTADGWGRYTHETVCGIYRYVEDITDEAPTCLVCVVRSKPLLRIGKTDTV